MKVPEDTIHAIANSAEQKNKGVRRLQDYMTELYGKIVRFCTENGVEKSSTIVKGVVHYTDSTGFSIV